MIEKIKERMEGRHKKKGRGSQKQAGIDRKVGRGARGKLKGEAGRKEIK